MSTTRTAPAEKSLAQLVRGGLAWGTLSTVFLRLGGMVVGVIIARLVSPTEFGVYAVAFTVQSVLVAVADLGLSADLIRHSDSRKREPTVATLAAVTGFVLMVATAAAAAPLGTALGASEAASAIAILSATVFLAGLGVVPFARLTRAFDQRRLFLLGVVDFVISTVVTIGLVALGWGVLGLAIGRAAAQCVSTVLLFALARVRPRFGLDRSQLRSIVRFGTPVAGANVLSWSVFGIDKVILGRMAGPTTLGYYVLAFNVSAWPMSLLGQAMRSVALPLFSRDESARDSRSLSTVLAPVWTVAALGAAAIGASAHQLVMILYGEKWAPAAEILVPLAILGGLRVIFDLFAAFLYARGLSGRVLVVQALWFVSLVVALIIAVPRGAGVGAAYAHVAMGAAVVLPLYAAMVVRAGAAVRPLLCSIALPAAAAGIAGVCAHFLARSVPSAPLALFVSAGSATLLYSVLIGWWALPRIRHFMTTGGTETEIDSARRMETTKEPEQ